jgi:TorA maturation chaperone TorD
MTDKVNRDRMAVEAGSRAGVYGFLSGVFRSEPTVDLIRIMKSEVVQKTLSEMEIDLSSDLELKTDEDILEDLAMEYTRLFIGPGPHISPHESVHRKDESKQGLLWGDSTVVVKQFVEWLDIAVEFELMLKLIERERTALLEGDSGTARKCLEYERRFIKEHLLMWIPDFCDAVSRDSETVFYREMARFTREFLLLEDEHVEGVLNQEAD